MRRIVPILGIVAALAGCNPTGNGAPTVASTHFRIANFVLDGTGMSVANDAGPLISNTPFGSASL